MIKVTKMIHLFLPIVLIIHLIMNLKTLFYPTSFHVFQEKFYGIDLNRYEIPPSTVEIPIIKNSYMDFKYLDKEHPTSTTKRAAIDH